MSSPLKERLKDLKNLAKYSPECAEAAIAGIIQDGLRELSNQIEEHRREILKVEAELHARQRSIEQDILDRAGNHVMRALQEDNVEEAAEIWEEFNAVYEEHIALRTHIVEHLDKALVDTVRWHNDECKRLSELRSRVMPKLMMRAKDGKISISVDEAEKENVDAC